ncbi:NUDIX hydrolase [Streptomyces sp. cmx-4-9]|uniref:NUDIX hydrolase n=1 Tax=Streptomyces sp. cmx-4-9 TaxID=2790941 RepID=UPI00397EA24B
MSEQRPVLSPDEVQQQAVAAAVVVHEGQVLLVRRRVAEGRLSWQFPAGKVEAGETGQVHPVTGRLMSYTACAVVGGTAHVADADEIAEVAWATLAEIPRYVPYGIFEPVQQHLDAVIG